jgi:hypothetical protein
MYVDLDEWLDRARTEYLQTFIRDGGASVKFLVPSQDAEHEELRQKLEESARDEGYQFAFIDAAQTKVHMIDKVFHAIAIARQVDWDQLAFSFLSRILPQNGYKVPSEQHEFSIHRIAELNSRDPSLLLTDLKGLLEQEIFKDYRMCLEFRLAMLRLCQAALDPDSARPPRDVVHAWLTGTLRRISEMKPALVFQKITRHNARHMLSSLSHWITRAGKNGLVLALDISRCLAQRPRPRDPDDDSLYYSKATALDAYESLRQCVDAVDEMENCFIVVIVPSSFVQEHGRRSVWRYDALRLRIWDEVRDEHRANPLSPLIRLKPRDEVQR